MRPSTASPLLLAALASAQTCVNLTLPITIQAQTVNFKLEPPSSDIDVTNLILNLTQSGGNLIKELSSGTSTTSGNFSIAGTYCQPGDSASPPDTLQILTHGIGFDRSYWDLSHNAFNYSYVRPSVANTSTATFAYDRLGIGASTGGDPINEVQAPLELAALRAITQKFRAGAVNGISASGHRFRKIVHVGHSFGSGLTYNLALMHPNETDGIVLSGYSATPQFMAVFAAGGNFVRVSDNANASSYPDGYLAVGDVSALHANFFAPGDFDPEVLAESFETGQPVAIGELLTNAPPQPSKYGGPVLVITGERDVPFCGGNCYGPGKGNATSVVAAVKQLLPKAKFESFVVPGAGHGLNQGYSHSITYEQINKFVNSVI